MNARRKALVVLWLVLAGIKIAAVRQRRQLAQYKPCLNCHRVHMLMTRCNGGSSHNGRHSELNASYPHRNGPHDVICTCGSPIIMSGDYRGMCMTEYLDAVHARERRIQQLTKGRGR